MGTQLQSIITDDPAASAPPAKDPRTGRTLTDPKVVDYDMAQAPPVVRMLVDGVRALPPELVKAECVRQWPREFPVAIPKGFPTPPPQLEWVGLKCQEVTPYDPVADGHGEEDRYHEGDTEECITCDRPVEDACVCMLRRRLGFWLPEDLIRGRKKLEGYVVGISLGVTRVEEEPITDPVKAAVNLDTDLARRKKREISQKRAAAAVKDWKRNRNRKANKEAKAQRKAAR